MLGTLTLERFSLKFWNGDYTHLYPSQCPPSSFYLTYQSPIIPSTTSIAQWLSRDSKTRLLKFIFHSAKTKFMTLGKSLPSFALVFQWSRRNNNRIYLTGLL